MAKDLRVILIKIADRLHNMRTLNVLKPEKQKEIAQETLDIYAPLSHRLGISKLRYELEDLSFKYLDPEHYFDLADKIKLKQSERMDFIKKTVNEMQAYMAEVRIESKVEGRPKHFFSIYKKMISKNLSLEQIFDLFAVRIIVNEVRECYEVLGVLHDKYTPVPGRVKDHIGVPKANRYQSLHTTLMCKDGGEPIEVQIRTWEMHRVSEYGVAAHWKYKEGEGGKIDSESEEAKMTWLRQMLDWQRELSDSKEFLDALKTDLSVFKSNVYCFSPKGRIVNLANGSTPIDFAYAIHSAVGNRMIGARVNGSIATFDHVLKTGDRVEIITNQNRSPSLDWLKIVKTSQARSKIRQWFKKQNRAENIMLGRELLETEARKMNVPLPELLADGRGENICERFNCADMETLYAAVGFGGIRETVVSSRLYREYEKTLPPADDEEILRQIEEGAEKPAVYKKESGIHVQGVGDTNVRFSKCCNPLPGDEIVGFITRGRGTSIHTANCANIINLDEINRQRLIDAQWQLPERTAGSPTYHAELRILCDDRDGLLMDVHRFFIDEKVKVTALSVRTEKFDAIFNVGIEINDSRHLDWLCSKLLQKRSVQEIKRVFA
jgi:GTP pyrophosphokinase